MDYYYYWLWTILSIVTICFLFQSISKTKHQKLPPGPRGLPILGSLNLLGKFPHRDLQRLGYKYGPIMHLRLGQVSTIVVSSPDAAELFLRTHDTIFANRPSSVASRLLTYGGKELVFSPYGSYWRNIRKMCTLELLTTRKFGVFKAILEEELGLFIQQIRTISLEGDAIDLSAKVSSLGEDINCRTIFGRKYPDKAVDGRGFRAVFQEIMQLSGAFNFGDYIPLLAPFDLQGLEKRMKAVMKVVDRFMDNVIDEHLAVRDGDQDRSKDFVDVMLGFLGSEEYQIDRDNIKALVLNMFGASLDTSATTIEWALTELIKHPEAMNKLRFELNEKVGLERAVSHSDLDNLEFLWMVIKETFRLHPVGPLLVRTSFEDQEVHNFSIPQNSRVLINVWAIGRDPSIWSDPEEFFPERFVGANNVDIGGSDMRFTPFGSGRRGCPGRQSAMAVVGLVVAQLVHCFDWELPDGMLPSELDMTEEFGLLMPPAKHLVAIPKWRLLV